ncbi:hypothetical protein K2173_026965 [Erythroxylum novogranatense]|uniref:DUF1421 domain-containing protein n=1 Tax=Erythroxylum novogranatense TaxID=1862640 RepID=A0AAV8U095_9ROSI|nr:hypothetical protein K2173_026965 [Erythroxylum novogranatense]
MSKPEKFRFMDKQVTELSKSQTLNFLDDDVDDGDDDDFHLIRSSQGRNRVLRETDLRGWTSMGRTNSTKIRGETIGISSDVAVISEIDRKMKEHSDVILHSVECLSARVSQMESRAYKLENSFDDLKEAIEFYQRKTERKQKELENILNEVQGGVEDLKDKQEIAEVQLQLAKLQLFKNDFQLEKQGKSDQLKSTTMDSSSSASQQPGVPLPVPTAFQQAPNLSSNAANLPHESPTMIVPATTAPPPPIPGGSLQPFSPFPRTVASSIQNQESYHSAAGGAQKTAQQQYHMPSTQQSQPSPYTYQPYQSLQHFPVNTSITQVPQVQPPFPAVKPELYGSLNHHPDENYCFASQKSVNFSQLPSMRPASHQFNMDPPSKFIDPPSSMPLSSQELAWLQQQRQAHSADFNHSNAFPTHDGSFSGKHLQSLSTSELRSGSSFSQVPTAHMIPHAIPTASTLDDESDTGGNENREKVDDLVDNVVVMGFRRDLVRATVKKLTENGQSVDLNMVLDKMMNNG